MVGKFLHPGKENEAKQAKADTEEENDVIAIAEEKTIEEKPNSKKVWDVDVRESSDSSGSTTRNPRRKVFQEERLFLPASFQVRAARNTGSCPQNSLS